MKERVNIFKITVVVLLSLNLVLTAISLFRTVNPTPSPDVKYELAKQKAITDYHKQLGKESFKVINDSVFTSSYGAKNIKGTLVNTSDKAFDSVNLQFAIYENGVCVDTASAYISYCEAGTSTDFEVYISCESFDEYQLKYISAYEI